MGSITSGFATGSLFSYGGGKLASLAQARFAPVPVLSEGLERHALAPNVARFNALTDAGYDHAAGGTQGAVNQLIRPGADREFDGDVAPALVMGLLLGSKGMTVVGH